MLHSNDTDESHQQKTAHTIMIINEYEQRNNSSSNSLNLGPHTCHLLPKNNASEMHLNLKAWATNVLDLYPYPTTAGMHHESTM